MSSLAQDSSSRRLRERRIRAGLSQRQLARLADVAPNTVAGAERGTVPTHAVQVKIAGALDVDRFELWPLADQVAA